MPDLDAIDHALLDALQHDGRRSNKELAARVGLAPSSCHARVRRLLDGPIRGVHAAVDPAVLGIGLMAMISLRLRDSSRQSTDELQTFLWDLPEIVALYQVSGEMDFMVHAAVRNAQHLRMVVSDQISTLPQVERVITHLIFEHRQRGVLPNYAGPPR